MGRDRRDSLSSDDSLSKSDSLSSSEERQDNRNDRNNRQRSSSESISSDDKNKSKKDKKSKSSKDSKKDKEKEKKKDEKSKKGKKKISKEDKKDKKKKHKSGKDKKSKKEKKEKKSKKDSKKYVQQPTSKASKRFGKYGIINKEHAYEKRDEFQQWLADVKKLNIEALTQNEERKLFDDFIEDYNTASMPEQKYYDLGLWEQYLQAKQIGKKIKTNEDVGLDDEALKKLEREKQRQAFETQATAAALNTIYTQGNMASEIQETEAKRALMQQSYKIGDIEKALEIQKELVPEKKKPGQQV